MKSEFRFRTPLEAVCTPWKLSHSTPIVCIGSCFAEEGGNRLQHDGFDVLINPFGALYNPLSLQTCLRRALMDVPYTTADLTEGPRGYHCLDYSTRFSGNNAEELVSRIETTRLQLRDFLLRRPAVILTLGSAYVYRLAETATPVGNCHKFPAAMFSRSRLSVSAAVDSLLVTAQMLFDFGIRQIILTVSPIRHLADGLHGNNLSKSTLLLAADAVTHAMPDEVVYFPAYEALIDDLRDYRFYAADMKHPSEVAAEYVYQHFADTFFDPVTYREALECRAQYRASLHRPIL